MKKLLLIDAHSLIYRSFHALPPLTSPEGEPIGAVYGLASTLLKTLQEEDPDYVAAAFDRPETTFRKEMFEEYKAHRPEAPDDLISQIEKSRELFVKFGIPVFEMAGYEGDDIIGTLVKKMGSKPVRITILTGDLDTLQLVQGNRVAVKTPRKGVSDIKEYNERAVEERFGIPPKRMIDYKGLVGDSSDNIPGVSGVGPKTALKILEKWDTVEKAFANVKEDDPLFKKMEGQKDIAFLSKKLATISDSVPISVHLEDLEYKGIDEEKLASYLKSMEFSSLVNRIEKMVRDASKSSRGPSLPDHRIVDSSENAREAYEKGGNLLVSYEWKRVLKNFPQKVRDLPRRLFDLKIAAWLIDSDAESFDLEKLVKDYGIREKEGSALEPLFRVLYTKLKEYELLKLAEEVEFPLISVLAEMEIEGVRIDKEHLLSLKRAIEEDMKECESEIYRLAGSEFNVRSPQQVSEILFDRLNIHPRKKRTTKTGLKSTAESVLLSLKEEHEIIPLILRFRENEKIRSTYVEPILSFAEKKGEVHTSFVQTGTGTGRLSSEKPNLQNIPQESKWSGDLRSSFIANEGWSFVSFDYSQLELRLLAHVSSDEKLKSAFRNGKDIHALTASQIFNISTESVSPPLRRVAKTLNFGIIYGMGARAFSETSKITVPEAKKFIDEYFAKFSRVKEWQESVKSEAQKMGYVTTETGRRRWFQRGDNPRIASEIDRAAVNMIIQGLGADILKMAMVQSASLLKEKGVFRKKAKPVLSIHDELIFEISDDILEEIIPPLREVFETAYPLEVPLSVETKKGKSLGNME